MAILHGEQTLDDQHRCDRCDGTLVAVQLHAVEVSDLVKHITTLITQGHSYLAKAPSHK